jgi:hypothetical protein
MRPGHETSTHYFSCSGGTGADSTKSVKTHYAELVFLHPMGSTSHVVHSGASGVSNVDAIFFMLRWDRCGFHEKCTGTCYTELVFFHPVGCAGNVVHSGADSIKKCAGTHYAELVFRILCDLWIT